MCGIGGFFGKPLDEASACAEAMLSALAARGPDAHHVQYFRGAIPTARDPGPNALLHARLSIIDPRPEADQPMRSTDGQIWLCYNGEVYGWEDDTRSLAAEAPFHTRSDTEFILRGAEAWGLEKLLPRLTGMFAFALLDLRRRQLTLVRDRFGKKPLLWWADGRRFAFASTLRALLPTLPPEARRLSPEGLDAYLAHRYIPAPRTIAEGVHRLPAGHLLTWCLDGGEPQIRPWWSPVHDKKSSADWKETLDLAIRRRCVADRPVGLFLSGGIDSTVVAARLAKQGQHFAAFTATFPGTPYDESPAAADLCNKLGLSHHQVAIPASIRDDFPAIVAALDEPFADPSSIPLWYLSKETTRHVKVVLGGDGGDELLAGYKRYGKHLRSAFRGAFTLPQANWPGHPDPTGWLKLRQELAISWEDAYSLRFSGFSPMQRRFLQPRQALPATYWFTRGPATRPLDRLLAIDWANYLPEYILRKGDLTTMAHGLELRAPLLDHHFAAAVAALPPERRFTQPAKKLFAEVLPADITAPLFSGKKRGFNPPLAGWLQDDLADRYDGLGARLEASSQGQLEALRVDCFCRLYQDGAPHLAENVLQLLILDESLTQLKGLGLS